MLSPLDRRRFWTALLLPAALICLGASQSVDQGADPNVLLKRAVYKAELYNWADAEPEFGQAEELFKAAGDERNALYARCGKIRSTLESEGKALPVVSAELGEQLRSNPLLSKDKELRMFCLIVKGDIDTESDTRAMRRDWEEVQALAGSLGNAKWQNRALAQLGLAAFYEGDIQTARTNVGKALAAASLSGDRAAQIRFLGMLARGLVGSRMFEQALPYAENALKIAATLPDAGYPFLTQLVHVDALIGLNRLDEAQSIALESVARARQSGRKANEATVLITIGEIARLRHDYDSAFAALRQAVSLTEQIHLSRVLAEAEDRLANLFRETGNLEQAQEAAERAAAVTQEGGEAFAVPGRLNVVARVLVSRGKYREADEVYDRASAFIDSTIGNVSTALDKTALIRTASDMYSEHFGLVAERFDNPGKAYAIIEQVRGRVINDLLRAGSAASEEAGEVDKSISQLRLKLIAAHTREDVRRIRNDIFKAEQNRWMAPGVSILKSRSHAIIDLQRLQGILGPSQAILEYVVADPRSYCLVVSREHARIVPLESKDRLDALVGEYLKAVSANGPARTESRRLYDAVLGPIAEAKTKESLVIVRDGQLHRAPFDALADSLGRYVVQSHTVTYAPSATSFYFLSQSKDAPGKVSPTLLGVGGVSYNEGDSSMARSFRPERSGALPELPGSLDEIHAAEAAIHGISDTILIGSKATETAFKIATTRQYTIVHMAVHGYSDASYPERAALLLTRDPQARDDGVLQASEIAQLKLKVGLVVLSACDTAVGPLQGQEGVATLSRAFLLAGATGVVSTLWSVDDTFSLYLMKAFYKGLASKQTPPQALTAAKREMLRQFGDKAHPYYWAGYTFEGAGKPLFSIQEAVGTAHGSN